MSSTTSNNHHGHWRPFVMTASILLLLIITALAYYLTSKPSAALINTVTDATFAEAPEDTSIGRCRQHPIAATALQKLYLLNDPGAKEKYTDKTVYVTGQYIGDGVNQMGRPICCSEAATGFTLLNATCQALKVLPS